VHDLHFTGPNWTLPDIFGPAAFGTRNLAVFSLLFWFNRAYRCHPGPIQLEGIRMAEVTRSSQRRWFWMIMAAGLVAALVGFWAMIHLSYDYGAASKSRGTFGAEAYNRLASWITNPPEPNGGMAVATLVGFGLAGLLQAMRVRYPWWPFHPLGFAVTASWEINLVWMPLFLAWLAKLLILRYGGLGGFRRALPFFYGLVLGQFVIGSFWNIYGILRDVPTYQFWQ
jgi:vacuolar-type H+-ATPase subunit I/STV1